jgi:hypothetical protein
MDDIEKSLFKVYLNKYSSWDLCTEHSFERNFKIHVGQHGDTSSIYHCSSDPALLEAQSRSEGNLVLGVIAEHLILQQVIA